jgi:DNA repair exonuclease SbcCD ATPase subunit
MKLKRLEVNAFGGINPASPVVIDFTQSKFVTAHGDMGLGKTSLLNAMLVACGALSKENKNFANLDSGKIDINFSFVGKDRCNYEVRCTKSAFTLKYEGENVSEPISKMKELLGVVGISPMEVKYKPLKEIVKWLASYSNKTPEGFEGLLVKYKEGIKKAAESRATANKAFKATDEYLNGEEMFLQWEESEKKYITRPDIQQLSAELEVAEKKTAELHKAKVGLSQYIEKETEALAKIAKLKREISDLEVDLTVYQTRIESGKKYIVDNEPVVKEYDTIKKKYEGVVDETLAFNKWESIKEKKKERDEFETAAQRADANEKSLLQELKELQAEILPDLKNVELVLEDTHENGKEKKEGLYVDGKNFAQLSETELWCFVMQIWRKFKVKVIVIDNMQSLGSYGVELLTKLSKEGAFILATQMERKQKTLEISYE